jgi:GxxExxY protein
LYPELSYQIVGILFATYNQLGFRYREKYYQEALSASFKKVGLSFKEQVPVTLEFNEKEIGNSLVDFIIEDKIVLEIKKGERFFKANIDQIYSYLKITGLKLGILANFTKKGLQFKRIINLS